MIWSKHTKFKTVGIVSSTLLGFFWATPNYALDGADIRVMVTGDSISGGFEQASYRMPLYNSLKARNCIVDMVGDQQLTSFTIKNTRFEARDFPSFDPVEFPDHPVGATWSKTTGDDVDHAGFGGLTADELRDGFVGNNGEAQPVSVYAQQFAPHYILMHYGTNDVSARIGFSNVGIPLTDERIDAFAKQTTGDVTGAIEDILASHPDPDNVKILVGNFIPRESERVESGIDALNEKATSDAYRVELTQAINALTDSNPNIRLVDVATGFDVDTMTFDGIHPNRLGELHLASAFRDMIVETGGCEGAEPPITSPTPVILTPVEPGPVENDSATLTWTAGEQENVEYWWLRAGPNSDGRYDPKNDYYNSGTIRDPNTTAHTLRGLPGGGATVYVSLWAYADGVWTLADIKTYTNTGQGANPATQATPAIVSPASPGPIDGDAVELTWTDNDNYNVTRWWVRAGSHADGRYDASGDYHNSGYISYADAKSHSITGLPGGGRTVYISLWYFAQGEWNLAEIKPYLNTGDGSVPPTGDTTTKPSLVGPDALSGSSANVSWTSNGASDIKRWWVRAGSESDGSYDATGDYYNSGSIVDPAATSATVTGLPADGSTVYISLWYYQYGKWSLAEVKAYTNNP